MHKQRAHPQAGAGRIAINPWRSAFMTTRRMLLKGFAGASAAAALAGSYPAIAVTQATLRLSEAQWRDRLTPAQFNVLREAGTEMPFSSPLDTQFASGRYDCAGCAQPLFSSRTKFDSGTGWPSFYAPLPHGVVQKADGSLGIERTEIRCSRCDGHLGHVFEDGPRPTGLRYCMNGVALNFVPGQPA
jgi:peptide-methionine (R)-S-oxide reductase